MEGERSAAERIERGKEEEEELSEMEEGVKRRRRDAGGGTGRRGVVLTRTDAFLIIICLSLGISREERGKPRGERAVAAG